MNIQAYLFTINKNNSFRLDSDEIKDVLQDLSILFLRKSYNDYLTKKKVATYYFEAVKRKIKNETIVASGAYLDNYLPGSHEIEVKRLQALNQLKINETQEKIIKLLIAGYKYKEIRKKLRITEKSLNQHIFRIKINNVKQAQTCRL